MQGEHACSPFLSAAAVRNCGGVRFITIRLSFRRYSRLL
jgi:hypothetical protein